MRGVDTMNIVGELAVEERATVRSADANKREMRQINHTIAGRCRVALPCRVTEIGYSVSIEGSALRT